MSQSLEQIAKRTLDSVRVEAKALLFAKAKNLIREAERTSGEHIEAQSTEEHDAFMNIMGEAYGVCFDEALQEAERYASQGNVGNAVTYLSCSREYKDGSGRDWEGKWKQVMDIAYRNGVEFEFGQAEKDAKTGYFYGTEKALDKAKQYASRSETEFSEDRAEQIMNTACKNGIELYLGSAEKDALEGRQWFKSGLTYARDAAKRIGIDIEDKVAKIESLFRE